MKNIAVFMLCIIILLSCVSCTIRKIDGEVSETSTDTAAETTTASKTESLPVSTEPAETEEVEEIVPVGIYNMTYCDFGTREDYELQENFVDDGSLGRDICVFAVFPSLEKTLSGQYFLYIWQDTVKANPLSEGMKIGYRLAYSASGESFSNVILSPDDISTEFWDHLEVYIYDDVNQEVTAWHSHLLEEQMTDETLVTSFKITAGEKIAQVSDIKLTAFLYSPEKADEIDGDYIDRHGYTVSVEWYKGRA